MGGPEISGSKSFSCCAPRTCIPNFWLAGDWVRSELDFPFIEAAIGVRGLISHVFSESSLTPGWCDESALPREHARGNAKSDFPCSRPALSPSSTKPRRHTRR